MKCSSIALLAIFFIAFGLIQPFGGTLSAQGLYDPGYFQTPISRTMFEEDGFSQWCDGVEQRIEHQRGISQILNSHETHSDWRGIEFGNTKQPGVRHVRIPLKETVPVGSLFVCGIGTPSVLKEGISLAKNADLTNESLWIPGQRILDGRLDSSENGLDEASYFVWVFPPGTKTAAIRFTHDARATDKSYTGWLGGIYALSQRFVNIAPYGMAFAESENHKAAQLNDNSDNQKWQAWDNGTEGREITISRETPEIVSVMWEQPVTLNGLCTIWTGFWNAEIDIYVGSADKHPNESTDRADWKTVATRTGIRAGYSQPMFPIWFDFGQAFTTRAVRIRINEVAREDHEHIRNNMKNGRRVWLGELLAMAEIPDGVDPLAMLPKSPEADHSPIPIRFSLEEDSLVTLVIERPDGTRVRNLIAETLFSKGENTVYWDGSNDLLRDREAARHGVYNIPTQLVEPGKYVVRGLSRKPFELRYEFSVYNEGQPPWTTADNTGGWLTNHTPPGCALWVPDDQSPNGKPMLYLGSYVSEGGHGLAWFEVSEDAKLGLEAKKIGGLGWIGGNWTGAQHLTRDAGEQRIADHCLYVGSVWGVSENNHEKGQAGEIRISAVRKNGGPLVHRYTFRPKMDANHENDWGPNLGGIAAHDGVVAISLTQLNRLVFMNAKDGSVLETVNWFSPGGIAYNARGELFLLSEGNLYRWKKGELPTSSNRKPFVTGLDSPKQVTFDVADNIYISENGESHCVRVFDSAGKEIRTIGKKGKPAAGPYDERRMNHPNGMTVDAAGRIWVTETDFQPKRVSVWSPDGKLLRAFYGPAEYGGGGKLDPIDPTRFYYHGMEFQLDWMAGTFRLVRVYYRPESDPLGIPDGWGAGSFPESPLYPSLVLGGKPTVGERYFTNCYNNNPTNGTPIACIWYDDPKTGMARMVAAMGSALNWSIFQREEFRSMIPEGIDLTGDRHSNQCRFLWSDLNRDGNMQPGEVQFEVGSVGGVTVGYSDDRMSSLQFLVTRINDARQNNDKTPFETVCYEAKEWKNDVPIFDFQSKRQVLASNVYAPRSTGGDQALYDQANNWTVLTLGLAPFAPESVCGIQNGKALWSYPNPWPGLHASHESPKPNQPGQLIGVTRLLGDMIRVPGSSMRLFAVNGNQGNIYLMTSDGLFVAELFHDVRLASTWSMPLSVRNMEVGGLTLHDENFWPSITQQLPDGKTYLVDGANSALVRIDGLDTIRAIPPFEIELTKNHLQTAENWLHESELKRQSTMGRSTLRVPIRGDHVKIDGLLDDWAGADWAVIDRSGMAAWFESDSKPYDISASLAVSEKNLVIAFRTNMNDLLRNSGVVPEALFKSGGCLDVMLGVDPMADPDRRNPVAGDIRLLVTRVDGKLRAVLYRAVVPATTRPVPFSSPSRTITIDEVIDISDQLEFAAGQNGVFELSIPLERLELQPKSGMKIKGDLGVLRGDGTTTLSRTYWSNKATAIVSDVPSEAQLTPSLWGTLTFE